MTKPALETGLNEDEAGLMHTAWPGGDGPHGSARVIGQPGVDRHFDQMPLDVRSETGVWRGRRSTVTYPSPGAMRTVIDRGFDSLSGPESKRG